MYRIFLYGCETWSLTLREECRLRVFENRILRRIFGFKRDVNREWKKLHNEKLHSLYRSPNTVRAMKSRKLRCTGHETRMEEGRRALKVLMGKPTGKRHSGRARQRGGDNIRIDIKEICVNTRNWVDLAQDRDYWRDLVNAALSSRVPQAI